jgi:hypothetical protein
LLHYSAVGSCPITPVPQCGQGNNFDVVAQDIWPNAPDGKSYFVRADQADGVQLQFQVGATAGTGTNKILTTTTYQLVNTLISINRSYLDTAD